MEVHHNRNAKTERQLSIEAAKQVQALRNKKKSVRSNTGAGKAGSEEIVKYRRAYELDPGCTFFPPGDWGRTVKSKRYEDVLHTVRLAFDSAVTADGSGAYATVFSNSPVQAQNWANYAAVFDSYRVLCYKVTFEPFWTVNVTFAPMASVIDRSDSTALTSYGLAERYDSHHKAPGKASWVQIANMSGTGAADFVSTASPAANLWVKTYLSGNTASLTFGRMNCEMLVQFRGVGIN